MPATQERFAAADTVSQPALEPAAATDAAEQILGANPLLGVDREELLAAGRRLLQGFVAWRDMLNRICDRADTTTEDRERARFELQLFTETFAPTNSHLGNPGALQRLTETRGRSFLWGLQNFIDDLANNFGMPRQVDEREFQVGGNLATTAGAVCSIRSARSCRCCVIFSTARRRIQRSIECRSPIGLTNVF